MQGSIRPSRARRSDRAQLTSVPTIRARALFGSLRPQVIDLRSPGEHAEDHVPGAVNVPLFDDLDRSVIGTLYARSTPDEAFDEAAQRVRKRIAQLTARVAELTGFEPPPVDLAGRVGERTAGGLRRLEGELVPRDHELGARDVVLHCWRGGLRSRSVVAFLRELGLRRAVGLQGGYKAYRAEVRARLARWQAPGTYVLRGLTGVGKSLVLSALEELRPRWTIDLEGLAAHRSSILGAVGKSPVSQKRFESLLVERLRSGFPGPLVLEGESRKVGDIVLPAPLWKALSSGTNFELTAPLERRVRVLVDDYLAREENRAEIETQLPFLEQRLGPRRWGGVLVGLLRAGRDEELVAVLLERYYDPLYRNSERGRSYAASFDASDVQEAAAEIADWIGADRRGA